MMTILDPRPELVIIEQRFAGYQRLNPVLAAVTPMTKRECMPIGWDAVNFLQRHREWLMLCEYSDWLDRCKEPGP